MEKLKAVRDFDLIKEKKHITEGEEIFIKGDNVPEDAEIVVDKKRAKEIEDFRFEGEALVERIKVEDKEDDNDDDANDDDNKDDDNDDVEENEDGNKDDDKEDLKGKEEIETADLKKGKVETATVKSTKKSTKK